MVEQVTLYFDQLQVAARTLKLVKILILAWKYQVFWTFFKIWWHLVASIFITLSFL